MTSSGLFDVTKQTCGVEALAPYVRKDERVPETLQAQRRLLAKWRTRAARLHEATRLDPEITDARQLERVAQLVDHAFASNPFYHQLYRAAGYRPGDIVSWQDYDRLPSITKQDIVENAELFLGSNLGARPEDNYAFTTSGSSGQVLTMRFDQAAIDEDLLRCMRFYEQILGRKRDPSEWLYQVYLTGPPFTSLDGAYPIFTVSNECPPEHVLEHLRRFKPALLSALPSFLERLAELVADPRELGVQAIVTNSESSTVAQRARISEAFRAPVFDEYSSVELALIATQCRSGRYHIVEDGVRVDVLEPSAQGVGEVVATSLFNSFMPLIRYRQGDVIQIGAESSRCDCGSRFRHLASFMGRTDQFLLSRALGKVPPDRVMALYDRTLLERSANVAEFQIVQSHLHEVRLLLVPAKPKQIDAALVADFCEGLKTIFEDAALTVLVEEHVQLAKERSHKRRLIKCDVER